MQSELLNQNTVIPNEARSSGIMQSAVNWCHERGYGIVQLSCPEFTYLGPDRPSMTREQYDIEEYRAHCRQILQPIMEQLIVYSDHGYELVGGLGISQSPSCDPGRGVFFEEFQKLCKKHELHIDFFWQIPATETGYFDPQDPATVYGRIGTNNNK